MRALLRGALFFLALCATSCPAHAEFRRKDQVLSAYGGGTQFVGADRLFYTGGYQAGASWMYHLADHLAIGLEGMTHHPGRKNTRLLNGFANSYVDTQATTLGILLRCNILPSWSWTPYVAGGWGLTQTTINAPITLSAFPQANFSVSDHYWRGSAIGALGIDWTFEDALVGIEASFQTFDNFNNSIGAGLRVGYRLRGQTDAKETRHDSGLRQEDQLFVAHMGAAKVVGGRRPAYTTGYLGGIDWFYHLSDHFAFGLDATAQHPGRNNTRSPDGSVNSFLDTQATTLGALIRFNLLQDKSWTPYAAAGWGATYTDIENTVAFSAAPRLSATQRAFYWRGSAIGALGVDWVDNYGLLGLEARFQTFDRFTNTVGGGLRAGWRFGPSDWDFSERGEGAIREGDQLVALRVGGMKMAGADRLGYTAGYISGMDWFSYVTDWLAFGLEGTFQAPSRKNLVSQDGSANAYIDRKETTLGLLLRADLLPNASVTPYVAGGWGMTYSLVHTPITVSAAPQLDQTLRNRIWRGSAIAALGADYVVNDALIGVEGRFQTFDKFNNAIAALLRVGYRFGRRELLPGTRGW